MTNKGFTAQTNWPALQAGARLVGASALLSVLAACNSGGPDSGPGGVSEGEASALDEAAERLDQQQLPDDSIPPVGLPIADEDKDQSMAAEQQEQTDSAE